MRCYQHRGVTKEACDFLSANVKMVPLIVCPKCGEVISKKMDCSIYVVKDAFYDDGPSLYKYNLKDGRIAKEVVQAMPWSSGPVGFLCLEVDGNCMFEWPEEEIDNC